MPTVYGIAAVRVDVWIPHDHKTARLYVGCAGCDGWKGLECPERGFTSDLLWESSKFGRKIIYSFGSVSPVGNLCASMN